MSGGGPILTRAEVEAWRTRDTPLPGSSAEFCQKLAQDWLTMEAERRPRAPGEWRPEDPVWPPPERN